MPAGQLSALVLFETLVLPCGPVTRSSLFGFTLDGRVYELLELAALAGFSGRDALARAEQHVKSFATECKIVGDARRCRLGWLLRWAPLDARPGARKTRSWGAWEREHKPVLLVVPSGIVMELPIISSIDEALRLAERSGVERVYEIDKDYDTLVNAGVEGWHAEAILRRDQTQIDAAFSSYRHGMLDPAHADAAKLVLERIRAIT
jgi:hypothetical protein